MTVSVAYFISKSCTTCLFISKSFKELFFMAFFSKADAKVRTIFELPKLFRSFFSKSFFWKWQVQIPVPLFSISTHLRFSLESGCKSTALRHILQTSTTLFSYFFAVVHLSHWFSKDAVQHILNTFGTGKGYRANIIYSIQVLKVGISPFTAFTVHRFTWSVKSVKGEIPTFYFQATKQLP